MNPIEQAESRGHRMGSPVDAFSGSAMYCEVCSAGLVVTTRNPNGFGSALERDCVGSKAA